MKVFAVIIALVASSAMAQEILEVTCGQDAIIARFNKQTADAAEYEMADLHFNDVDCFFDEEIDGYYVKTMDPLSSCGTQVVTNDTHATFINSISSGDVKTGLTFPHGIIVGQPENQNLISVAYECTYEIDLRLSASFIPNITFISIPIPDAIGEGVFQVAMAIYKSALYREVYSDGAPTLQPEETVFVGITMVGDASSDLFILMRRCWATVFEDPDSEPYHELIVESCPVPDAVEGTVRVRQNGINQQALWETEVFKFVGDTDDYNSVWLHCDITICVQEVCPVDCDARRRRRSNRNKRSIDENTYTMTVGPVTRSRIDVHLHGPDGSAVVIVRNETVYGDKTVRDQPPQTGVTDHTLLIVIGAFAAFCLLCLSMALAIVLMRLKRAGGNGGEPSHTGTINKGFSI